MPLTAQKILGAAVAACFTLISAFAMAAESGPQPVIYGIHVGLKGDFWTVVEAGAKKAAEEGGYGLVYLGAPETDVLGQKQIFHKALESGAKGIFIAPNSDTRAEDVALAKKRGIPVVYIDRTLGQAAVESFIGTDNLAAGAAAGEEMIRKIGAGKKVRVVVFRMSKDVVSTVQRETGFIEAVTKAGHSVVADPYISTEVGDGRLRLERFLSSPDMPEFDAIFTPNEKTTNAVLLALRGSKKAYVHIGFDSGDLIKRAIGDGRLYGTIIQQPFQMGYHAVGTLDKVFKGEKVAPFVESKFLFVSKDNIRLLDESQAGVK